MNKNIKKSLGVMMVGMLVLVPSTLATTTTEYNNSNVLSSETLESNKELVENGGSTGTQLTTVIEPTGTVNTDIEYTLKGSKIHYKLLGDITDLDLDIQVYKVGKDDLPIASRLVKGVKTDVRYVFDLDSMDLTQGDYVVQLNIKEGNRFIKFVGLNYEVKDNLLQDITGELTKDWLLSYIVTDSESDDIDFTLQVGGTQVDKVTKIPLGVEFRTDLSKYIKKGESTEIKLHTKDSYSKELEYVITVDSTGKIVHPDGLKNDIHEVEMYSSKGKVYYKITDAEHDKVKVTSRYNQKEERTHEGVVVGETYEYKLPEPTDKDLEYWITLEVEDKYGRKVEYTHYHIVKAKGSIENTVTAQFVGKELEYSVDGSPEDIVQVKIDLIMEEDGKELDYLVQEYTTVEPTKIYRYNMEELFDEYKHYTVRVTSHSMNGIYKATTVTYQLTDEDKKEEVVDREDFNEDDEVIKVLLDPKPIDTKSIKVGPSDGATGWGSGGKGETGNNSNTGNNTGGTTSKGGNTVSNVNNGDTTTGTPLEDGKEVVSEEGTEFTGGSDVGAISNGGGVTLTEEGDSESDLPQMNTTTTSTGLLLGLIATLLGYVGVRKKQTQLK